MFFAPELDAPLCSLCASSMHGSLPLCTQKSAVALQHVIVAISELLWQALLFPNVLGVGDDRLAGHRCVWQGIDGQRQQSPNPALRERWYITVGAIDTVGKPTNSTSSTSSLPDYTPHARNHRLPIHSTVKGQLCRMPGRCRLACSHAQRRLRDCSLATP